MVQKWMRKLRVPSIWQPRLMKAVWEKLELFPDMLEDMIWKRNPVVELQDLTTYLWKSAHPEASLRYRRQRKGNDGPRRSNAPGMPTCPCRTPTSSSTDVGNQEPRGSTEKTPLTPLRVPHQREQTGEQVHLLGESPPEDMAGVTGLIL